MFFGKLSVCMLRVCVTDNLSVDTSDHMTKHEALDDNIYGNLCRLNGALSNRLNEYLYLYVCGGRSCPYSTVGASDGHRPSRSANLNHTLQRLCFSNRI